MNASDIIASLGGRREVAEACGLKLNSVGYWERRQRISPRHAARLASLAHQKGRPDITERLLVELWADANASREATP